MKSCKFCSTHVEDSVTHCPSCGSNTFRYLCENCGTAFDSAYCPNCGIKAGQKKKVIPSVILFTSPLLALTAGIQKLGSRLSNRQSFMNVCM